MAEQIHETDLEQIEETTATPEVSVERKPAISGGQDLQAELGEMADSFNVGGFKCAHPECGLVHGHDTNKHRASDDYDMSENEAADMEANPNCHCGLNELAHRDDVDGTPSPSRANDMAPVPETMARHLDASF